jgi:transposase
MPSAVRLRKDFSAEALRPLAKRSKDANQSRRLLSLAAVRDGMDRGAADKVGGMDRQTLRECAHRFNAEGPEGLLDHRSEGPKLRLTPAQLAEFSQIVETGPDPKTVGVIRWRRVDLKADSIAAHRRRGGAPGRHYPGGNGSVHPPHDHRRTSAGAGLRHHRGALSAADPLCAGA